MGCCQSKVEDEKNPLNRGRVPTDADNMYRGTDGI